MSTSKQLPYQFYDSTEWQKTILDYYGENPKFHGRAVLNAPVVRLTQSVATVINIYGNYPESVSNFFKQTTNPLFDKGEYQKEVYDLLVMAAEDDPFFLDMGNALLLIRQFYLQDKIVLPLHFQKEIDLVKEATPALQFLRFSEALKTITNTHIQQITHMIDEGSY
jgi:hypothetical protein